MTPFGPSQMLWDSITASDRSPFCGDEGFIPTDCLQSA